MIFSKFKNRHFLALVGNLIISGFSVITISVLYRILTKSDVGAWFFFLTVISLADAVRNGFLNTATIKFYAGTSKKRGTEVLGSVWFLSITLTLVLVGLNIIALGGINFIKNPELILVIKWLGITFISSLPYSTTYWILMAEEGYLKMLWLRLINSASMILIIIVLALIKQATLFNILLVNVLTNCLTSIVAIIWGVSKINTFVKRSKATTLEIMHFGKYSLATNLSSNLLSSVNTFIITFMLGPASLAVYNLPQRLMELVEIPLRSFVGTGMSAMATAFNTNNIYHLTHVTKKYAGMLMIAFIPTAIFAFFVADYAVLLLGGNKYIHTEAANIFRVLMFVAILYPIDRFNGVTLDIIHQQKINFYKVLVMLTVNVPISFIGIYLFKNVWGAVIAVPFTLLAGLSFGYYHLKKHLKYSFRLIVVTGIAETKKIIDEKILKRKS